MKIANSTVASVKQQGTARCTHSMSQSSWSSQVLCHHEYGNAAQLPAAYRGNANAASVEPKLRSLPCTKQQKAKTESAQTIVCLIQRSEIQLSSNQSASCSKQTSTVNSSSLAGVARFHTQQPFRRGDFSPLTQLTRDVESSRRAAVRGGSTAR